MFYLKPNSQITMDDEKMFGEFYADAVEDLDDNLEGVDLAKGSIALVIGTGDFYVLDSEGVWQNQTSTGE